MNNSAPVRPGLLGSRPVAPRDNAREKTAAYLQQTHEMSQRRACRVIDGDRASVRYQARRPDDGELRERLKAVAIIGWRGKPATIVSDNGTELTSNAILEWADQRKIGGITSPPASPSRTASARASTASCATNC